jgi:helicase
MKGRGNGLEASITNFFLKAYGNKLRLVGVSASVDDNSLADLRQWIKKLSEADVHAVKSKWRPTRLVYHFPTYQEARQYAENQNNLLKAAANLLTSIHRPVLAFVHTKKIGYSLKEDLTKRGIACAFHCADFKRDDRLKMEKDFTDGKIKVLVATSTLAVGCDFPVEEVAIIGVHRGLHVVELDTLQQMAGRSGHQGTCEVGVVHCLVPNNNPKQWKDYFEESYSIRSELGEKKWLAFHTIAEIANAAVATEELLTEWFQRTLASHQSGKSHNMAEMINYLKSAHAIEDLGHTTTSDSKSQEFFATKLGKASARFYFDPMDVYKWYSGVTGLSVRNHAQACAILASAETFTGDLLVKEKDMPSKAIVHSMSNLGVDCPSTKAQFFFYLATYLSGDSFDQREKMPMALKAPLQNIFKELKRVTACLQYVCANNEDLEVNIRNLGDTINKIVYGVPDEVLDLVRIPFVGRANAKKLYDGGIKLIEDVATFPDRVTALLGPKMGMKIHLAAREMDYVPF